MFSPPLSELLLQVSYDCKAHKKVFFQNDLTSLYTSNTTFDSPPWLSGVSSGTGALLLKYFIFQMWSFS